MQVVEISPAYIRERLDALVDIAADVPGEYWTEVHFLADLPQKWTLSFVIEEARRPIAYSILSEKAADHCHLHHFMVHRESRGRAVGQRMMDEIVRRVSASRYRRLTLKIAAGNDRAEAFYTRNGFREVERTGSYRLFQKDL